MSYHKHEFDKLNQEFEQAATVLLDSKEPSVSQLENVLDCFNTIIGYSEIDYEKKKPATKEHIESALEVNRVTLRRCFEKLNLPVILPGKLLSTIHYVPQSDSTNIPKPIADNSSQTDTISVDDRLAQTDTISVDNRNTQTDKMPETQTKQSFLKSAGPQLNYKYSGDPLKLKSFIADVEIVQDLIENDGLKDYALKFVRSKLEGRAEEFVPDDCKSIDDLIEALKAKIKPENSKIIEGKMLALRLKGGDFTKFSDEMEKLSEALRRTLIVEGISKAKAEEMTISKTIDTCRKNTKIEIVKSVLESRKYDTPLEVIATFITQSDSARREQKEAQNAQKKTNDNANKNGKFNKKKSHNSNRNGSNNQNSNRSDDNGNQRGNNRNRNSQNRGQNGNRSNRNEHTIRIVTGSQPGPSAEVQQPQHEQFFRAEN